MPIKLVCFDLDGVLVDACELHKEALNEALTQNRFTPISDEEHLTKYNGLPTLQKLELYGIDKELAVKINEDKQKITKDLINLNIREFPEIVYLVDSLKFDCGLHIAVVTNCSRETANMMLYQAGITSRLQNPISLLVTNEDVEKHKPNPEGYVKAMNFFNASYYETIIVEDSPKGIAAAKATGSRVIEVKNPYDLTLVSFLNKLLKLL